VPDHNTIANFRRDNPKAIKKVFRATVEIANHFKLIGGKLLAGDSSKFRAQNSKKNNYTPKKIERHIAYIDQKLEAYSGQLAEQDNDKKDDKELIETEIKKQKERKAKYNRIKKELEESGEPQVSTTDPDSRQMIIRNMITEVAYNVQTTVDAEHHIPIDYQTTNTNDSKAMGKMLRRAKSILKSNEFIALYDKGYHTGSEFKTADDLGIKVLVAIPGVASSAPNPAFNVEHFTYHSKDDTYTCPANAILKTNGSWYRKNRGKSIVKVKHYKTTACETCQLKVQCTRNQSGRLIERPQHAALITANHQRIEGNKDTYKRRQSIVEHPYGTIKRQWGFSYIMTKRFKERAEADVGLMFTAYNLRRIINIVGISAFKAYLGVLIPLFLHKNSPAQAIKSFLSNIKTTIRYYMNNLADATKRFIFAPEIVKVKGF
jgi:hypothetical protein